MDATDLRTRARDLVRALAAERQGLRRELFANRADTDAALLAGVEALDMLRGAAASLATEPGDADMLELTWQAARERLASAGVALDGAAGEAVDLSRHRVIRKQPAAGGQARVLQVVSPGVVFKGRRLREAVVVAEG